MEFRLQPASVGHASCLPYIPFRHGRQGHKSLYFSHPRACLSTQYPVPSTQYPVPSTQYPVPSTQYPVPSTPVPSTQYPVLRTDTSANPPCCAEFTVLLPPPLTVPPLTCGPPPKPISLPLRDPNRIQCGLRVRVARAGNFPSEEFHRLNGEYRRSKATPPQQSMRSQERNSCTHETPSPFDSASASRSPARW